jgi:hypothetical protein
MKREGRKERKKERDRYIVNGSPIFRGFVLVS